MFLLGSFTNGLFGGTQDVLDIANKWNQLKASNMQLSAAKATQQAMGSDNNDSGQDFAGGVSSSTPPSSNSSTSSGLTASGQPDLNAVPLPKYMSGLAGNGAELGTGSASGTQPGSVPFMPANTGLKTGGASLGARIAAASAIPTARAGAPQYLPTSALPVPSAPLQTAPTTGGGTPLEENASAYGGSPASTVNAATAIGRGIGALGQAVGKGLTTGGTMPPLPIGGL